MLTQKQIPFGITALRKGFSRLYIFLCPCMLSSGAAVKRSSVLYSKLQQCWGACESFNQQQRTISLNVFSDGGNRNGVKQGEGE